MGETRNKRILVIANMYPTAKHPSFGIFIKNQVDALRERGVMVDVVSITNPANDKLSVLFKYVAWMMQLFVTFVMKGRMYSVVHAHYVFPSGYFALFFKRIFRSRMIVTAHGGDIDRMARKNKLLFTLSKKVLQEADSVIAVGEELQQRIIEDFKVDQTNVSLINMGVNRRIFKPERKELMREQLSLSNKQHILLYVGNVLKQKGLRELVEAAALLKDKGMLFSLYCIGAMKSPSFYEELKILIEQKNVQNEITYVGVKSQKEIAKWMAAADCLVLPSHLEGFGLVALEAMSCGTAVVGTDVGGLKYLLKDDAGRITPAKDASALAESLVDMLSSEETRGLYIQNGLKKAEEYDQERMLNRVMEVYFPTGG